MENTHLGRKKRGSLCSDMSVPRSAGSLSGDSGSSVWSSEGPTGSEGPKGRREREKYRGRGRKGKK